MKTNVFGFGSVLNLFAKVHGVNISNKRNTFVAENFISSLVEQYGKIQFTQTVEDDDNIIR